MYWELWIEKCRHRLFVDVYERMDREYGWLTEERIIFVTCGLSFALGKWCVMMMMIGNECYAAEER